MKICQHCGNELMDEAVICTGCGCVAADHQQPFSVNSMYSQDHVALKDFEDKVNSLYTMSIVALILCLGIGIIFSIVAWLKTKDIFIPSITSTNPNEIAMFEATKRKLKRALGFANLPWAVWLVISGLLIIGEGGTGIAVFIGVLAIGLLIQLPCTKHLNSELYGTKK